MVNSDGQLYKVQSERLSPPTPRFGSEADCDDKPTTPVLKKHKKSLFSSISQDELIRRQKSIAIQWSYLSQLSL